MCNRLSGPAGRYYYRFAPIVLPVSRGPPTIPGMKTRLRAPSSIGRFRCRWGVLGAAAVFASAPAGLRAGASYALQGFTPGQAMAACPSEWQSYRTETGFACIRHGGKLASRPILATFLRIENGKLRSVWIDLKESGDWVHVQAALAQTYGPRSDREADRAWVSPDAQLSVGPAGGVLLLGSWKAQRRDHEASAADL